MNSVKARIAAKFWELSLIAFLLSLELYQFLKTTGSMTALFVSILNFSLIIIAIAYLVGAAELWPFKKLAEGGVNPDDPKEGWHDVLGGEAIPDEVKEVQDVMIALKAKMDEAVLSQKRFLADASHEMRSPITVMKGNIEIALRRERDVEEYKRVLSSNLEEIDRLEYLLRDLMFLARSDASELAMNMTQVRLDEVLEQVVEGLWPLAEVKSIDLKLDCRCREESLMEGDRERLRQLFGNLVENALRYTPGGGRVDVVLKRFAGVNKVVVSDTGIGIPKSEIGKLFERFYRVDKARSRESGGTGLGLCICKWLVDAHNGDIFIESAEGAGTKVTVMFISTFS